MAKEIYLYSGIHSFVAENFNREIDAVQGEDVTFRVSSGGGDVFGGWPMVVKMGEHTGKIKIKVDGIAASMAAFMLPYADEVEAVEVAKIMVHRADGYVSSDTDRAFLKSVNDDLRKQFEKRVDSKIFKTVTGKTIDDVFNGETRIDVWLTAKEAKQIGLVDKVVSMEPKLKAEAETMVMAIAATAGYSAEVDKEEEKPENKEGNQNKTNIMTIAELKAQHPTIAASLINEGVSNERDRVGAFMAFAHVDIEAVKKGIESGDALTQTATAEFTVKMINAERVEKLEEGSEEDLDTSGEGKEGKEAEAKAKAEKELADEEKALFAELGIESPTA